MKFHACLSVKKRLITLGSDNVVLSLSHTEHGWAHSSNTVYSVIHGLTGTSIELQPSLWMI